MTQIFSYFSKSIRRSLYLLVGCAILPALLIILYVGLAQRSQAVAEANEYMANLTNSVVTIQTEKTSQIKVLLQTLSSVPVVKDQDIAKCKDLLAHIMANDPAVANVLLVSRNRDVLVSGRPFTGPVRLADRKWFKDAIRTHDFSVGGYAIGRILGTIPIMQFGYPLLGEDWSVLGGAVRCL